MVVVNGVEARDGWRDRLEAIAGRRIDAWVVAGIVVVVAATAVFLWARGGEARVAPPSAPGPVTLETPAGSQPGLSTAAAAGAEDAGVQPAGTAPVIVHVAGAVRHPGVYELENGARVADAIELAGGARSHADLNALNLAMVVTDGMQVLVPEKTNGSALPAPASPGASTTPAPALVNINTADGPALETVPGIGPVTAAAILQYREQSGPFASVNELIEVSGIGPATLESIRPYVTV